VARAALIASDAGVWAEFSRRATGATTAQPVSISRLELPSQKLPLQPGDSTSTIETGDALPTLNSFRCARSPAKPISLEQQKALRIGP
jgi:hypothetical protein